MAALSVKARQTHRLHHRLGARHVERDFIQPRDFFEPLHVLQHARVVRPQHRPQRASGFHRFFNARLVEVLTKPIDAVRAGQVMKLVAVQIFQHHTAGSTQETGCLNAGAPIGAVLKRNAVGAGELQVRNAGFGCVGHRHASSITLVENCGEPIQTGLALFNDSWQSAIRQNNSSSS